MFGGAVANPLTALCWIVGRRVDRKTGRDTLPGFYDEAMPGAGLVHFWRRYLGIGRWPVEDLFVALRRVRAEGRGLGIGCYTPAAVWTLDRKLALAAAAAVLAAVLPAAAGGPPAISDANLTGISSLEPASSGGLPALDRALARLSTHRRLMVLAAHPDDEDTGLLTWVARGLGGESAYLSLSRGDGGQNLIGPETGIGLGLLRSRELLAARRIDGARQYFTRAFDFGYTRRIDETLERWPKEVLLADALAVVRRFKPQVLVAVFPPDERAGHGQHQASSIVAEEVFSLAADPEAFSEGAGPGPWSIDKYYRAAWWNPEAATLEVPLGRIEPWSGRSILQIALASRSQHRCQDMGFLQPLGDAAGRLSWVAGAGDPERRTAEEDLFAGVDTRLAAIAELLPEESSRRRMRERLERVAEIAVAARSELSASDPGAATEPLLEILRLLRTGRDELLAAAAASPERHLRDLLDEKLAIAQEAAANAAQVLADAVTGGETVVPGERLTVRSIFWNAGSRTLEGPEVEVASGGDGAPPWRLVASATAPDERSFFSARATDERDLEIEVPAGTPPTVPYFLRQQLAGDLYDWSAVSPELRGRPFGPPPLALRFRFSLGGVPIVLEREVVYRYRDQAYGEVRRPLRVVPKLEVGVGRRLLVWPISSRGDETFEVEVRSNVDRPVDARLEVTVPEGWLRIAPQEVTVPAGGRALLEVTLRAPEDLAPGRYAVDLAAVDAAGERFDREIRLVDYEHIRPTPLPAAARLEVSAGRIRLPDLRRLGYVRGASDRVPELLREIGLPLAVLSAEELAHGDLSVYDAIVVGSRAYEVDRTLVAANPRLLDYARGGGLLIVQYQQYQFVRGGHPPYPLDIERPHDRVTDETAPVRLLEPEHPVFTVPNRLDAGDWQGWVQERGLYFAGTWDDAYRPLLAMADPGGEEQQGALLVARLGDGHYVYTGLAFFRQLPAGVTGAYRLFANLLALGS